VTEIVSVYARKTT